MAAISPEHKAILSIGLIEYLDKHPELGVTSKQISDMFDIAQAKAHASGYHLVPFSADPDDLVTTVERLRQTLLERQWDGVSIGFGVRGTAAFTEMFEKVVNMCFELVNPPPKMMFAYKPNDLNAAVERVMGLKTRSEDQ